MLWGMNEVMSSTQVCTTQRCFRCWWSDYYYLHAGLINSSGIGSYPHTTKKLCAMRAQAIGFHVSWFFKLKNRARSFKVSGVSVFWAHMSFSCISIYGDCSWVFFLFPQLPSLFCPKPFSNPCGFFFKSFSKFFNHFQIFGYYLINLTIIMFCFRVKSGESWDHRDDSSLFSQS